MYSLLASRSRLQVCATRHDRVVGLRFKFSFRSASNEQSDDLPIFRAGLRDQIDGYVRTGSPLADFSLIPRISYTTYDVFLKERLN